MAAALCQRAGLVTCAAALAGILAYRSIPEVVAAADLIVVGQVANVEPGPTDGSGFVVILPTETLKGSMPRGALRLAYKRMGRLNKNLNGQRLLAFAAHDPKAGVLRLAPYSTEGKPFSISTC